MTARHSDSHQTIGSRRGPRHRLGAQVPAMDTESVRTFRDLTDGLSNRLALPSIEGMRAGTVNNPISLMRRFLLAMRSAGLPKERAERVAVWLRRTIDSQWPLECTPRPVLEQKAKALQCSADCAEKRLDLEKNAVTLRERIQTQTAEVVGDMMVLAKLERELEDLAQ